MRSLLGNITAVLIILLFSACDTQWDSHIETNEMRGKSLMEVVSGNSQTSAFAAILRKTGYDKLLSGDKMLTVFVPSNSALSGVDMNNVEELKRLVKNHVAYSNYSVLNGSFTADRIEMMNAKKCNVSGLKIDGVELNTTTGSYNITAGNGILHIVNGIIPFKMNIWEYLQSQTGNHLATFVKAQDKMIMDMVKSIQIGVDPTSGKPLYDTVWINTNPVLNAYPINDESKVYTFALLPNSVVERLETKYAKYFAKANTSKQDSIVRGEVFKDCILVPVEINENGKFASIDGVLMDIKIGDIEETYSASNGTIYKLTDADVKIYENKVKTIHIEAENYHSVYSNVALAWVKRYRPSLSGGIDMVLNSPTIYATPHQYITADTTITTNISRTFYPISSSNIANVNNSYIEFRPTINSVAYKVYWSAHNDYSSNSNLAVSFSLNTGTATITVDTVIACKFSQKMLLSFPDKPAVRRNASDGTLVNNFSPNAIFTSSRFVAGLQEEKQLYRSLVSEETAHVGFMMPRRNTTFTSEDDYFSFYAESDQFGDKETIINPTYGVATVFVANTAETKANNPGMILLDYIKLVPIVDPNE